MIEDKQQSTELTPYDDPGFDDGITGYEDRIEGDETQGGRRGALEGRKQIGFTNDCHWEFKKGDKISPDHEFLFEKVKRVLTHWGVDGKPTKETRVLKPRELWPLVNGKRDENGKLVGKPGLNDKAPKSEWRPDPHNKGKKKPPYQQQWLIFVRDIENGTAYVYPTSTDGGHGATSDLIDEIEYMRRRTKKFVVPIMRLSKRWMPTQHGGRDAPKFICARWVGGDEGLEIEANTPKPLPNADLSTSTFDEEGRPRKHTRRGVERIVSSSSKKKKRIDDEHDDDGAPFFDDEPGL